MANPQCPHDAASDFIQEVRRTAQKMGPHLDENTLARLAEGVVKPNEQQERHLGRCRDCRELIEDVRTALQEGGFI